jgi:hypothetical protein
LVVALRTRRDGSGAYVRVESPIGAVDLSDGKTAGRFLRRQSELIGVVVVNQRRGHKRARYLVVRCDMPLPPGADHGARVARALTAVASQADELERQFMGVHHDLGLEDLE